MDVSSTSAGIRLLQMLLLCLAISYYLGCIVNPWLNDTELISMYFIPCLVLQDVVSMVLDFWSGTLAH